MYLSSQATFLIYFCLFILLYTFIAWFWIPLSSPYNTSAIWMGHHFWSLFFFGFTHSSPILTASASLGWQASKLVIYQTTHQPYWYEEWHRIVYSLLADLGGFVSGWYCRNIMDKASIDWYKVSSW